MLLVFRQLQGHWLWRSSDLEKPPTDVGKFELLLSDWQDANPLESVVKRARVLFQAAAPPNVKASGFSVGAKQYEYYCTKFYQVKARRIRALTEKQIREAQGKNAQHAESNRAKQFSGDATARAHGVSAHSSEQNRACSPSSNSTATKASNASRAEEHKREKTQCKLSKDKKATSMSSQAEQDSTRWLPLVTRAQWEGIQYINKSNILQRARESLTQNGPVTSLALSPSGEEVASTSMLGSISIWDVQERTPRGVYPDPLDNDRQGGQECMCCAFTHNGTRCVVGVCERIAGEGAIERGVLKVFDVCSGKSRSGNREDCVQTIEMGKCAVKRIVAGRVGRKLCLFASTSEDHIHIVNWNAVSGNFELGEKVHLDGLGDFAVVYGRKFDEVFLAVTCGGQLRCVRACVLS